MPSGYVLLLVLHPHAAFSASHRTLEEADTHLCAEAGWPRPALSRSHWFRVDVETPPFFRAAERRPADGEWEFVGWDVVDSARHAALADFGFRATGGRDVSLDQWMSFSQYLNRYHLFDSGLEAERFSLLRDESMPRQAPFRRVRISKYRHDWSAIK